MKKKFLALVGAMVLTVAMSLNVCAAPSSTASSNSSTTSSSAAAETPYGAVEKESLATGSQQFNSKTIAEFAETTTIKSGVEGAKISVVSNETAAEAIAQAKTVVGDDAFVAAVFDLKADAAGTYTLGCPNVWAGQTVVILHQLSDGSWETITPSKLVNNEVTFTLNSYSAVAIVVDTTNSGNVLTAPKTGDVVAAVAVMAVICLAGTVVFSRKKAAN